MVVYLYETTRYGNLPFAPFCFFNKKWRSDFGLVLHCKPLWPLWKILKERKYPALLNMIEHIKTEEHVKYARLEILSLGNDTIRKIGDRIELCKIYGECKETRAYYKGIYNMYIKKGVTKEDCEAYLEWIHTVCRDKINEKAKEIREKEKEKNKKSIKEGTYFYVYCINR